MSEAKTKITRENGVWVLRLAKGDGKVQEYRCATESQARQLALVLVPPEPPAASA